jgi:hypothetical protein
MSDIVERLRQQATIEAKKFGDSADIQLEWKAADEITRLRADLLEQASLLGMGAEREEKLLARVEVLEGLAHQSLTVLQCSDGHSEHWCAHCDDNIGGSHIVALRAALEAKP